jgi:hypothetical protein
MREWAFRKSNWKEGVGSDQTEKGQIEKDLRGQKVK